ncbi:hybrid sensor histidine kinase/response regulator [Pseudodesulfovibrio piezophilus]|uniref:histidine kinase n=1 Tax=Pseudodesulfovibrio piezophilus (strain DSM 21447 / JCM 15486 / C1TLV30) TaxID=1322246 RepID=M1WL03_PSEP2|nr:hybrid sensor histidine kinase/response regulator [Pseudodesulfovibrio piezophilus]CCH50496.1 Response regulator receiver sensor signal transduction histidine kinase [Pseudodesulfovibrio piezophilus C1TLV30]
MPHIEAASLAPTILIVEDSRAIYGELKQFIESELAYSVDIVTTFDEAEEYFRHGEHDIFLAIVDLHLPGSPNGEIVDRVRKEGVPVLVFTSDISSETRERMQSKGIIDYIVKDSQAPKNIVEYISRLGRNQAIQVLVVEDSDSFCKFLCGLLEKQMFQVTGVGDGLTAKELLVQPNDFAMVIIDYALPGMDGLELTKAIRETYTKKEMTIMGLSSIDDPMLSVQFIKNGANDFIAKPFEIEEFYCRVNHDVEMMDIMRAFRKADKVKNQFLGMAAHDLRSPINGIQGMSEMLLADVFGPLNKEQREMLDFIHEANTHMNHLVNDLLDISVIESGKLHLLKAEGNLEEMIAQHLRIHSFAATKKTISIKHYFQGIEPFVFDQRRVGQVIDNLMTNAIKFSPHRSQVEVYVTRENNDVRVCVRDYGKGVPAGEEKLLFQSFQKTSVSPTAGESSTGLGLPIVKKIVEAHGGTVWVESEYEQGATFCFSLPVRNN